MPASFTLSYDKTEPFAIRHPNWNKAVERIWQNRPLSTGPDTGRDRFDHPFKLDVEWSFETQQFVATPNPGFLRGGIIEARVPENLCGEKTLRRLELSGDGDDLVDAYLTERPKIPIRSWVDVVNSEGLSEAPYTIPEWFYEQGVPRPKNLASISDIQSGILFEEQAAIEFSPDERRLLKASDFTLVQPRPTIEVVPVTGLVGVVLEVQVNYARVRASNPFYVSQAISTAIPSEREFSGSAMSILTGESSDPITDELHMARVWLMGPRGNYSETVTPDWEVVVQHFVHWNLDYTVNVEIDNLEPFYISNPASFLTTGLFVAQNIVDSVNNINEQAVSNLNSASVAGGFWTV